jgi:glycosyltransferase involved in cell wall biosynthesis
MDCHVSPRVAYWTSAFEPGIEAIANEVALLRQRFPSSVAWGLSHRHWVLLSWRRGFCLNPRLHLLFRAAARMLEPVFQLNHIFGSLGDWFYLQGKRRRPTVLTMTSLTPAVERPLLERVDRFVVEYPAGREHLERLGIGTGRIRLIFPAVNLKVFCPAEAPAGPFTVLFASSPDDESWLEARGVPLLLEAAAYRPDMRFRLLWRPWGSGLARVRRWIEERGLRNVELLVGYWKDMARQYNAAHVTVAPFTDMERSKVAPNSLVESLACGRPVLVTEPVGLADLVREAGVGVVSPASGAALAERLDELQAEWPRYSQPARRLAERWFGADQFLRDYHRLYSELL